MISHLLASLNVFERRHFRAGRSALLVLMAGCTSNFPIVKPTVDIEVATGIGAPIVYHTEARPVDEPNEMMDQLDLFTAVRLTLENEPRIQAALSRVRIAESESRQTRLLPNPILSVSLRYPESLGKPIIDAGLAGDLIAILQRPRRADAADNKLRAASSEAVATVLDLLTIVQEHYVSIQASVELSRVLQGRLQTIDRLLKIAQARLAVRETTQLDVATLEAERVVLETEIADQQLEQQEERLGLSRLMGQPSGLANWRLTAWASPASVHPIESDWVRAAIQNRPEVQARRWELAALGDELALAKFAIWEGTNVGITSERDGGWSAGPTANVPLPLFDMGQAKTAKARAAIEEARHKLLDVQRQVIEDTRRAYTAFTSSQANYLRVRDQLLPVQRRRHDLAEAAYRAGQTDITAFFLAEQELREAESKLITQAKKATTAFIRLQRAAGGPGVAAKLDSAAGLNPPADTTRPSTQPAIQSNDAPANK